MVVGPVWVPEATTGALAVVVCPGLGLGLFGALLLGRCSRSRGLPTLLPWPLVVLVARGALLVQLRLSLPAPRGQLVVCPPRFRGLL